MRIDEIEIDDVNEEHVTRHGVAVVEIVEVLAGSVQIRRNRKGRTATHVAVGATRGGRRVMVPFIDRGSGRVRPIAAWEVGR